MTTQEMTAQQEYEFYADPENRQLTGTPERLPPRSFLSYDIGMRVLESARKHGLSDEDILLAASTPLATDDLGDDPQRQLRIGIDSAGRLIETVVLTSDDGTNHVIHAMQMRPKYRRLLHERGWR